MAKGFYTRLAAGNLWRSRRMYGPYCAATALISGMFYIILNLIFSRSVRNLSYGETMMALFTIGIGVMTVFTVGYMLYINSFLIKRRKKEFGLYGVLGMERRHVARVILWENSIVSLGSLALGIVGGMVFGRLAFLLLMNVLDTAAGSVYTLSPAAAGLTVLIFGCIFVLTTLYNLNQVRLASPVELLKGGQKGEKRVRWPALWTLLGAGMLGFTYYLAISVRNPAVALMEFWPAVILVIIATWLLFTGGSVFILERLKAAKRIYYRPRAFITISGLIHRMKQNAAGLANICILSTMVMVTVSCCCALYFGQEAILREQHPSDLMMTVRVDGEETLRAIVDDTIAEAEALAPAYGVTVEDITAFRHFDQNVLLDGDALIYPERDGTQAYSTAAALEQFYGVSICLLEDFTAVTGIETALAEDEAILLADDNTFTPQGVRTEDGMLAAVAVYDDTPYTHRKNSDMEGRLYVVVRDQAAADRLARGINPTLDGAAMNWTILVDLDAGQDEGYAYGNAVFDGFRARSGAAIGPGQGGMYHTNSIYINRLDGYSIYGGLLFLGVFFALLFLINTVLILYFKQISEGFDDSERFAILQKVGLSDTEVRATINRQMLIVFLLPLAAALVHIVAASNMIRQMLGTFMLTDFALVMRCILITVAVFVVVYLVMYRLTARTYYRLVRW